MRQPLAAHRRALALLLLCILASITLSACGPKSEKKPTVTIYTSIYENVIAELKPILAREFPDIEVVWYQKGSEVVASKVNSEIAAGRIQADLIMTSDPFWYEELKEGGHLLKYDSASASRVPSEFRDPDNAFVTVRMPVMVLTVNGEKLSAAEWPKSFKDLTDPKWAERVAMGSPLESGTMFTAVAALEKKYGWDFFSALRTNDVIAAGGNSTVLNRVTTAEKELGIILLENILKARQDAPESPVEAIYPIDGAIPVPSPIAIVATTANPEAAKKIYDFFLSDTGQLAMTHGNMYSPIEGIPPPSGARPWAEVRASALIPWSTDYLRDVYSRREEIKDRFNRIMIE